MFYIINSCKTCHSLFQCVTSPSVTVKIGLGKSESRIVNEGFKNHGKFETPGKTGKADQRKKWANKEPWPDAFSEDTYH
ncbi:hypothetical protein evm_010537 [Chilo suppressalis]|nr:hypothetical protein evm_010537 [Chilo suppressalis]